MSELSELKDEIPVLQERIDSLERDPAIATFPLARVEADEFANNILQYVRTAFVTQCRRRDIGAESIPFHLSPVKSTQRLR